ncbi:MAG: AAA family ATPase [Chlorobi bacterium]|nr:AAA family ATPase [Chlorobiota bacterium]
MELKLGSDQLEALNRINSFLDDGNSRVMILKGQAGTGKTTLISYILDLVRDRGMHYKLATTTGRAKHILAHKLFRFNEIGIIDQRTGFVYRPTEFEELVNTVHSHVYTLWSIDAEEEIRSRISKPDLFTSFLTDYQIYVPERLKEGKGTYKLLFAIKIFSRSGVMIVDESSMLSDRQSKDTLSHALYGTGNVLADLFTSHPKFKFIFIGDPYQLPPVNQDFPPALSREYLITNYFKGKEEAVREYELKKVYRHSDHSGILKAATYLRHQAVRGDRPVKYYLRSIPQISVEEEEKVFADYGLALADSYRQDGAEGLRQTVRTRMAVTLSNRRVNLLNAQLRPFIFGRTPSTVEPGDILLVTQNNHLHHVYNGELIQVLSVSEHSERRAGLEFKDFVYKRVFGSEDYEQQAKIIFDIFRSPYNNLTQDQQGQLMKDFLIRTQDVHNWDLDNPTVRKELLKRLSEDPYLNAVRATYGYVLTAHKAQGGEWERIHLFISNFLANQRFNYPYRWMYTALTRAVCHANVSDTWFIDDFRKIKHKFCLLEPEFCEEKETKENRSQVESRNCK